MKHTLLLLSALILFTGCANASRKGNYTEKNAPKSNSNDYEISILQRIYELKMGAKPREKPTGKTNTDSQTPPPSSNNEANAVRLADLAKEYKFALIKTNFGDIKVAFYAEESPLTVNNFLNLAQKGFYNNTKFHRIIKDFMIQGGDPLSRDDDPSNDGAGGPGYRFQDEINQHKLIKGSLAMANSGPNTNGSQFFIVTKEATPWLDGKHTNFGYVVEGLDVAMKISEMETEEDDRPVSDVVVSGIELMN